MATEVKEEKKKVEVSLEDVLGTPGADNMLHEEDEKKPGIFAPPNTDLTFLDNDKAILNPIRL